MRWRPLITFVQTAMDAANAMVSVPGKFGSFGHDYRADMVRFVQDAYGLPFTEQQLERIDQTLHPGARARAGRADQGPAPRRHARPRPCAGPAPAAAPGPVCRSHPSHRRRRWSLRRRKRDRDASSRIAARTG